MIRTAAALRQALLSELRAAAEPRRAPEMQRYLKTSMPILGVTTPNRNAVYRRVFPEVDLPDAARWRALALGLFRGATYREEWWAAAALLGDRRAREFQTMDTLPMCEEMIVTAAWWDVVDDLATHRLSAILKREPARMKSAMRAWSRDENLWKRRSAILCQVPLKLETDLRFLYDAIEPSLSSKEFFLRKAIGWALRQYARTDPDEIARYVRSNRSRLSGLSIREALKNIGGTLPGA
jgi:3-methyladenine DNA glycosylase AlkD